MSKNTGKQILNLIIEENVASAQEVIVQQLTERLAKAMDEKFEEYASTIFESSHKKKKKTTKEPRWQDSDGDGKWYEPGDDVKAVNEEKYCEDGDCEEDEGGEGDEEAENEKPYGKQEEKAAMHKGGKKKKKKHEEEKED